MTTRIRPTTYHGRHGYTVTASDRQYAFPQRVFVTDIAHAHALRSLYRQGMPKAVIVAFLSAIWNQN